MKNLVTLFIIDSVTIIIEALADVGEVRLRRPGPTIFRFVKKSLKVVFCHHQPSAVQSSAQPFIHNIILFINTYDNTCHNQAHWLIGMPYLSTIASSNGVTKNPRSTSRSFRYVPTIQ